MQREDLASRLYNYVTAFGEGKRIIAIHLFGIEFGESLESLTVKQCKELCEKAGFKYSLGEELHKGVKLAPYAERKNT